MKGCFRQFRQIEDEHFCSLSIFQSDVGYALDGGPVTGMQSFPCDCDRAARNLYPHDPIRGQSQCCALIPVKQAAVKTNVLVNGDGSVTPICWINAFTAPAKGSNRIIQVKATAMIGAT